MRLLALVLGLLPASLAAAEKGSIWPQHRGNPGSTGVSPDALIKPPLRLVWSYRCDSDTSGDAGAGLTVGGGLVFGNMEMTRSILALDAETGAFRWEYTHIDVHYQQTSSYADGRLFVWLRGNGRSTLVALDTNTGKPIWEKKLGNSRGVNARRSGPAVAEGKVLVADGDGASAPAVICCEAATGKELWRKIFDEKYGKEIVAPSIAGGKVLVGTWSSFRRGMAEPIQGAAMALDLADGKQLWINTSVVPTRPLVSDGKLAVVKFNGQPAMPKGMQKLAVLDAGTGEEKWSLPIWVVYGTTTITDKFVILKNYGGHMIAHDRDSGNKVWEWRLGGASGCSSPSISGDIAYVGTGSFNDSEGFWAWRFTSPPHMQKGKEGVAWSWHAIDLRTGQSVWQGITGNNVCSDPALAYGKVYLNSRDGRIYCYAPVKDTEPERPDTRDTSPNAPAAAVRQLLAQDLPMARPGKDWPTQGGTPARVGLAGARLSPPLAEAWTLDTEGRIVAAPVVLAGRAYVGSLSGKILCADLLTGARNWEFQTGGEVLASPAVADGMVYCGSNDGKMVALTAENGTKKWEFRCGGPVQCAPAVVGGVLFFGANDYHFYALDRHTGKKLWSFKTEYPLVLTPPVVQGDTVYAAQWIDWVYALDAATGKLKWRDCVPVSIESLHYYRDKLYLRSARQIAEYDPVSGRRLRLANAVYGYNGLAFLDNLVLTTGTGATNVVPLDQAGQPSRYLDQPALKEVLILGTKSMPSSPRLASMGTPVVIDDLVCFVSARGEVLLIKPDKASISETYLRHQIVWATRLGGTCHSSPIVADGLLLVGCDDGKLYAFKSQ
jgi:outer membrane protein assembly factor BamB